MHVAAVSQVPPLPRSTPVRASSRALVPLQPAAAALLPNTPRPAAAFLAQLLAHREGMDWTREKRRAAPDVAIQAYRDGLGHADPAGRLHATL